MMKPEIKINSLKNGIRVVSIPLVGLRSVTAEVFVKIGSKYEKPGEHGMSHFLEHMAFKGTEKRPSAKTIVNEIDNKGAVYNAGTGYESTSYFIKTVKANIPWAMELLADILFNPKMEEAEVRKEKGVIAEEVRMYNDNPMLGLSGEFAKFFYKGTKIGCWNISGEVKDVHDINRCSLLDYRGRYLSPIDILVVIAGDLDDDLVEVGSSFFSEFVNVSSVKLADVVLYINSTNRFDRRQVTEQGHFCVGVPTVSWSDKRRYALKLMEIILGGYSSSRLQQRIREDEGLAYYVSSVSSSIKEGGYMAYQAGVKKDSLEKAIGMTIEEIINFGHTISGDEIDRAKEYITGRMILMMDQSDFWTEIVGQRILLRGKLMMPEDEVAKYRSVKIKDIVEAAEEFFVKEKVRIMTISDKDK